MTSPLLIKVPEDIEGIRTECEWTIHQPWEKLAAKYLGGRASSYPTLDFDLYAAHRAEVPGWKDSVDGADAYATLLMNSNMTRQDVHALMVRAPKINRALKEVSDQPLAEADLDALGPALVRLFDATCGEGFAIAKVTKLLCLKRPELIPMLDSYVCRALWEDMPAPGHGFGEEVARIMIRFKALMKVDGNLSTLTGLTDRLNAEVKVHLTQDGAPVPHPTVTPVRVLESLVWFDWGGHENFDGWVEQDEAVVRSR